MYRTYLVKHGTLPKLIIFQAAVPFLNGEASSARKDPLVAFLGTDAAVAFHDRSELWDVDAELEGTAVAVALVGLEL